MKSKVIYALVVSTLSLNTMTVYAANDSVSKDENIVVGACMIQKFKEHAPPISEAKMEECSKVDASATPKCLGITEGEYMSSVKFCVSQLINAKCVAGKMKTTLIKYADCGYEKDSVACYKELGFTPDEVLKLSTECTKEGAK